MTPHHRVPAAMPAATDDGAAGFVSDSSPSPQRRHAAPLSRQWHHFRIKATKTRLGVVSGWNGAILRAVSKAVPAANAWHHAHTPCLHRRIRTVAAATALVIVVYHSCATSALQHPFDAAATPVIIPSPSVPAFCRGFPSPLIPDLTSEIPSHRWIWAYEEWLKAASPNALATEATSSANSQINCASPNASGAPPMRSLAVAKPLAWMTPSTCIPAQPAASTQAPKETTSGPH